MAEIPDAELADLRAKAEAADSAIAAQQAAAAEADAARASLTTGIDRYRATVAASMPAIPADAITGDTFDAIDAAATRARAIAESAVAAHTATAPVTPAAPVVPAGGGSPRNDAPDTAGMSPAAKIRLGYELRASGK